MLGQGSPVLWLAHFGAKGTFTELGRVAWLPSLILFVCSCVFTSQTALAQELQPLSSVQDELQPRLESPIPSANQNSITLRMSWGGGSEVQWQGSIRYSGGAARDIRALGLTQDTPGSVYLENGNVNVAQASSAAYGGVEFTVDYQAGSEIQTVFRDASHPDRLIQKSILIDDILETAASHELDSNQNSLTLARSPGDWLQLEFSRQHLVFETGEKFLAQVRPNLAAIKNQVVRCKVTLVPARNEGPAIWSGELEFALDADGNAIAQALQVPIPDDEGVYDLKFQLESKIFTQRIAQAPQTRNLQFVALSPAPPVSSGELWREQEIIDPTLNRIGSQWAQLLRASGLRGGATDWKRSVIEQADQRLVELEPAGWQAIGLRLSQTDRPVLLEIEYIAEEGAELGFSVLQPKANGQMPTYGFDSGVIVSKSFAIQEQVSPKLRRHQVLFWPRTNQPMLLVSNRSESQSAKFGKVRVLSGPNRLAADRQIPDQGLKDRTRQFMAFYESPMFPENFGASEVYEPAIDQTLDDWVTFYQGADRLIQYLKANGYTGTTLTVAADSGAIFPSQHLGATPIFDSGVFFSSGQDPIPKDVLEMLFRMFDREGLALVPAFAFSGPLPGLEAMIREKGASDFRPVDFRGQTAGLNSTQAAYTPMNAAVQNQVQLVLEEVNGRYTHHPSFKGVSLICRPDTYTQLSGRRWGYNSPTVAQFLNDSGGIQLASGRANDWNAVQNLLLGSNQQRWLEWRADNISNWYKRLYSTVNQGEKGRRLYLAPVGIYRHPDIVSSLNPSLHWSNRLEEAMMELGWSTADLAGSPSIVLLKPRRIDQSSSIAVNKVETQMEHSQTARDFFRQQTIAGEVFAHQTHWATFSELKSRNAFGGPSEQFLRLQQVTPSDWRNRQRFIGSLRNLDSRLILDGGWLLAMGQEQSLIDFVDVFTRLPDLPFDQVVSSQSVLNSGPVVVRQALADGRWYFYCLNDSPWEASVSVVLNRGDLEELESLSSSEISIEEVDGRRVVRLRMPPFSLVGGFSEASSTQAVDFEYAIPEEAAKRLKARLNQLQFRLIQATDVKPLQLISNASFDDASQQPAGWNYPKSQMGEFEIVPGSQGNALKMSSTKDSSWIRSPSFQVPETGRLSVSVWMKTEANSQPPVRIAIESDNNAYYRFGSTGSLATEDPANQIGSQWRQYVVHFDDLPVDRGAQLRIGFDLMGAGSVMIDRVELYDRLFDANDIQALTQRLAAARPLLANPTDFDRCRRTLNGYWLRFLDEYIGTAEGAGEVAGERGELLADQDSSVRTSSIFQRFRNMMNPRVKRR